MTGWHAHRHGHGHSHGPVDPSIVRSHAGLRAVAISLAVLTLTALLQTVIYTRTLSVAFFLRSARAERLAGLAVVLAIFVSACVALFQTIERFIHPQSLSHLWWLAIAGVIGFVGNEIAARIRTRAGRTLKSAALVADGEHARADGYVSLGVVASAGAVALGADIVDPIIGLAITLMILRITWQAWHTVRAG